MDNKARRIVVQYDTKCKVCKARIETGAEAMWEPTTRLITHLECATEDAPELKKRKAPGKGGEDGSGSSDNGPDEDGFFPEPPGSGEGTKANDSGSGDAKDGGDIPEGEGGSESDSKQESDSDSEDGDGEGKENPYPEGSRRHKIIEQHLENTGQGQPVNQSKTWTFQQLVPLVDDQIEPFVLKKRNPESGTSEPRPMDEQRTEFRYEVNRTIQAFEDAPKKEGDKKSEKKKEGEQEEKKQPRQKNPEIQAKGFVAEMQRIRKSLDEQAGASNAGRVDHVSYRPIEYGIRGIYQGISPAAMIHAYALHWPAEARKFHGIKNHDPVKDAGEIVTGEPELLGYVRKLADARIPIMLIGPAGAGKSRMAEKLAEIDFDGRFASCPLTAGIMPSWLIGTHTVAGWSSRPFLDIYANGGVFAFEEMDSADPNVLLIINNAIANGYMDNPNDGERYVMHENFQPVACCNTMGMGADRFYVGRERLDFATIDRFRMGRVQIGMDENVDQAILKNLIGAK